MTAPVVDTTSGRVAGTYEDGRHVFRGIPYAAPPIGRLRFRAPEPPEPWSGVREAKRFGHSSPQPSWPGIPNAITDTSEDCLTLNVYTPALDGSRPVLVWIHGGGLLVGTGSLDLYDKTTITRRDDLVVVTLNYRLGLLGGFMRLLDLCGRDAPYQHNCGLLDQVAALEWVRDNVAAFGGDPGRVTICGISGGGVAVGTLMAMPRAAGLFHRAISASGPVTIGHYRDRLATRMAGELLRHMNLDAKDVAAELPGIDLARLLEAESAFTIGQIAARDTRPYAGLFGPDESTMVMNFGPVVDGDVLPTAPLAALRDGASASVPTIIGVTRDECRPFLIGGDPSVLGLDERGLAERLAWRPWTKAAGVEETIATYRTAREGRLGVEPLDLLAAIESDEMMRIGALRMAEAQVAAGAPVWSYVFTWESPLMPILGAAHGLDESFVLGLSDYPPLGIPPATPEVRALSDVIQNAWAAFCRTGSPVTAELAWPPYDLAQRPTMLLDHASRPENDPMGAERRSWDGRIRV